MHEPGVEDATRRTRLANERTYLAWWRTGLTALALAVGIGRVAPEVGNATRWPYEGLGTGYGLLGIAFIVYGWHRATSVEAALDRGEFPGLPRALTLVLGVAGVVLALATVIVLLTVS